ELIGRTGLLCGDDGRYLGSRFQLLPEDSPPAAATVELARHAAEQAAVAGYSGPLGIDVLQYRDADGAASVRPLMDINPRLTMGRLSLALAHLLEPGEGGSWLHVVQRSRQPSGIEPQPENEVAGWRVVATSPEETAFGPVQRQTFAVLARSAAARQQAEQQLLAGAYCPRSG
ncbi:MAG: hypothetical protein KDA79_24785, partial [Planctomycetaceae bacterium]|nr:hypothetical protein [Planctomycetaceae bacterium]